jgi:hypothetical protein
MPGMLKRTISQIWVVDEPEYHHSKTLKTHDVNLVCNETRVPMNHMTKLLQVHETDTDYDKVAPCGNDDTTTVIWMDKTKKSGCAIKAIHYMSSKKIASDQDNSYVDNVNEFVKSQSTPSSCPKTMQNLVAKFDNGYKLASETSIDTFGLSNGVEYDTEDDE